MSAWLDLADAIEAGYNARPGWGQCRTHTFEDARGGALSTWEVNNPLIVAACAMGFAHIGGYNDRFKGIAILRTEEERNEDGAARGLAVMLNDKEGRDISAIVAALREKAAA